LNYLGYRWFELVYCAEGHFQQYLSYMVAASFIGGGNQSTWRKPPTCRELLTNFITLRYIRSLVILSLPLLCYIEYTSPSTGVELKIKWLTGFVNTFTINIDWVKLWVHAPFFVNTMKNTKYHNVVIIPKSNTKVPERGKIETPNTYTFLA